MLQKTITYKNVHNRFKFNGIHLNFKQIKRVAVSYIKEGEEYEKVIFKFLLNWLDEKPYIEVLTSGTTGKPKIIKIEKQFVVASALSTGDYLNLKPGDSALLSLSADYIAGKLMLVRSLILGLELDAVEPSSAPFESITRNYDFVAMVPLQVEQSIAQLNQIKTLIIGGSEVNSILKEKLQSTPTNIFETYGMTETVSHVAMKRIENNYFEALPNVIFSIDDRNCLIIDAYKVAESKIITNDLVELISEHQFIWKGRFDNIINSGGVKLSPEVIESKLQGKFQNRFFIGAQMDEKLGQKVVLVIESNIDLNLNTKTFENLSKYEVPKNVYYINEFVETKTNKINRKKTLHKIKVV
ncbi:AMP-binding protein [Flavobacterium sp.]|jgi:O-succinylbenzoic acid--CoA ligase|uniref:AMP-binding protein n=1 Tax=Flavobacterium sp. TaxID=239 RepID=UPI002A804C7A|nr:AMP-binding protein [Flavobacterium sp.]